MILRIGKSLDTLMEMVVSNDLVGIGEYDLIRCTECPGADVVSHEENQL